MTSVRRQLPLALLLFFLPVTCCAADDSSLYSLAEGRSWTYQMLAESRMGSGGGATITVTNMASRELAGQTVTPQRVDAGGMMIFGFLAEDEGGLCEIATQRPDSTQPEVYSTPRCYLRRPYQKGTTWEVSTTTTLVAPDTDITMHATIEEHDETITVPAGTFEHCLRVASKGQAAIDTGRYSGTATIKVNQTTWYCPGIGMVRAILKEDSGHLLVGRGSMTYQLVDHSTDATP